MSVYIKKTQNVLEWILGGLNDVKKKLIEEVKEAYTYKLSKYTKLLELCTEKQRRKLYRTLLAETIAEIRLQYGTLATAAVAMKGGEANVR